MLRRRECIQRGAAFLLSMGFAADTAFQSLKAQSPKNAPKARQPNTSGFFDGVDEEASREVMKRARQRIKEIRQHDFTVRLVDGTGRPLNGEAEIRLVRHSFEFGAAMSHTLALKPGHKGYQARAAAMEAVKELMNVVTVNCHWGPTAPTKGGPYDWSEPDDQVAWALANGLRPRMHALIYMNESYTPKWRAQVRSTEEWWDLVEQRLAAVAERYGDKYIEYDLINETQFCPPWLRENCPLFPTYDDPRTSIRIAHLARKYIPRTPIFPLDQVMPSLYPKNTGYQYYLGYCRKLIDGGAPIDGIGFQGHFYTGKPSFQEGHFYAGPDAFRMKVIEQGLDVLGALGKPMYITEFNPPSRNTKAKGPNQARLSDEEVAAWSDNFYTLAFSKPYIRELTRWFVIDTVGGRGIDAGLFTLDGRPKPNYHALKKLLTETWTSLWKGAPGNDGSVSLRGFYGTYEARIAGHTPARFEVAPGGEKTVTVKFT